MVLTPVMEEKLMKMGSLALGIAEKARNEGIDLTIVKSIRNLMKNMKLSAQQAMDVLEIPVAEQEKCAALL